MKSDELIIIGRIVAPHGVRGDLRILPDTDRPSIYKKLKNIYIKGYIYDLLSARPHKNIYIVHLEGIDDRNMAETLVGETVEVPFSLLPKRPEGAIYYFELIGMTVVSDMGEVIGTLSQILETGANKVYAVKLPDGKAIYLPVIPSCVLNTDKEKRIITVKLPEWA